MEIETLTGDAAQQLTSKGLDVLPGKWCKIILFQKIVQAHSQKLRNEAYMIAMVEPME